VPSEISSARTAGGIPSCLKRRDDGPQRHPRPYASTGGALQHHGASSVLDSILCSLPSASTRKPLDAKCLPSLPSSGAFRPGSILAVDRPVSRLLLTTNFLSFCPMAIAPEPWPSWPPWPRLPCPYAEMGEKLQSSESAFLRTVVAPLGWSY
jgi:hypothetical protein